MFTRKAQKQPRTCKRLPGRFSSVKKFPGHSRLLFLAESHSWLLFLWCEGGDDFLKARVSPQGIPARMQAQFAVAQITRYACRDF